MHFASYEFIFFLIILVVVYYIIPKKWQWIVLLAASYLFYSFAGIVNFAYILITTITTWFAAVRIDNLSEFQSDYLSRKKKEMTREERKAYKEKIKTKQRKWLIACMVINFGILAVLKYAGHFEFGKELGLLMPLGISFYTFQSMGYLIDVYRGSKAERNLAKLALFISFFPQLIQGPISRFNQLKETLFSEHTFDSKNISNGLSRILWGFFKKLVIADRMFTAVSTIISSPNEYRGAYVIVVIFFYAIELYADFTGGIDIAIGTAQLLGIRLAENFERPYFSKSIAEYWRRWHITLGTWFKDYLFYPISVSKTMLKLAKKARQTLGDGVGKRLPIYTASIIVWFTTGVWHGSTWNFIVWGLMNCFVILVSQECVPLYNRFHERFPNIGRTGWYRMFQVIRTFWLMGFIRTLDLYTQVGTTFRLYASIFKVWNLPELLNGGLMKLGLTAADYIVLALASALMLYVSLKSRSGSIIEKINSRPQLVRYAAYFAIFVIILVFGAYGVGYDANQFIYSRF